MRLPLPPRATATGVLVRWRFVLTVVGAAAACLTMADQLGWESPKAAFASIRADHTALRGELLIAVRAQALRQDRSDSLRAAEYALVQSLAMDLCLHRNPVERVQSGLPCRALLRDAVVEVPRVPGRDP